MKKTLALSAVLTLSALGMACGEAANNSNTNTNKMMNSTMNSTMNTKYNEHRLDKFNDADEFSVKYDGYSR